MKTEEWEPKTRLGKMVKSGEISDIDEILEKGYKVLEPEIVDYLIPDLNVETIDISTTQRTTDSGRRSSFRVIVMVGDGKGHVGVGVGKASEIGPAINYATRKAKQNIIKVPMGCGSWECRCGMPHSIPLAVNGKEASTEVVLKPAPRGVGLAANDTVKKVLKMAGVKDIWSQARGSTSNKYNMIIATIKALKKLTTMRPVNKFEVV